MHKLWLLAAALVAANALAHGEADDKPAAVHEHSKEAAFGRVGDPAKAQRTIVVEMRDPQEFSPSQITVKVGETVRFVVRNTGKRMHEMVLGTMQELEEHAATMQAGSPMHHHDAPHIAHVAPGKTGEIVWQFARPGVFHYGCLVEDHFELGMFGTIRVTGAAGADAAHQHADHPAGHPASGDDMRGMYGPYAMSREASGTAWQPDASAHSGIHAKYGEWSTMTHGFLNLIHDDQGGPRGGTKTFSTSMLMVMAQRPVESGTVGLRAMLSGDALMGKRGYPLLLQTGETANGAALIDRQHPHDLFMELSASYSRRLSERSSAFVYAGLPGEPALGPPAFMHRFSGEDNPEAPISHHWLDSTHVTFGVLTLGYIYERFKIEGSVFRGREPDENRYNIETGRLDSASARLSYNPTKDWALQVSRGRIKSPEALHPDADIERTTASAIYHRQIGSADTQTTLAWGRNAPTHGAATNALLLESALRMARTHSVFARAERMDKNELFPDPDPRAEVRFHVAKLSVGYVYDFRSHGHHRIGLGGLLSRYWLAAPLDPVYGNPTSFMLFGRIKMQ